MRTAACAPAGTLYAIGEDGEHAVALATPVAGTRLAMLTLATPAAAEPLVVTTADYLLDYMIYGVNGKGEFVAMALRNTRLTLLDGRTEALLYAAEGLLPGAIVLGDDFGLACITVYQAAEGNGVYATVTDTTLLQVKTESLAADAYLLQGIAATCEKGLVVVDWSAARGYVADAGLTYTAFIVGGNNLYVTHVKAADGVTTAHFPAAPGTQVAVWVVASRGGDAMQVYPQAIDELTLVTIPEAQPVDLYGLTNLRMGIAPGQPGLDGLIADFLPQVAITREMLTDPDTAIYFMTEDTYTCTAEDSDHTLMVTLYTPAGYTFYYHSGYVFMPEYAAGDLWMTDVSAMFADCAAFSGEEPWPAGEYTILYTIDGAEVNRLTFTLE